MRAPGLITVVSGRDYDDGLSPYFDPRFFGCRVCDLRLHGDELRQAGFRASPIEPRPIFTDFFDEDEEESDSSPEG